MATVDKYKIVLDVQGEQAVKSLTSSISTLGAAVAGIGIGAFVASAFRMADAMQDIADATGVSAGYVKAFSESLDQAGGSAEDAGKILTKFYQTIDDAAKGSDKAQEAFAKIGVTLDDLRNLSEQDLLKKTLTRLSEMKPSAERTALAMDVLGKSFAGVDPTEFLKKLNSKDVDSYNESIKKAADLTQTFNDNITALKSATVDVLTSLIGDIDSFEISADKARQIIKILAALMAGAFAAATVTGIMNVVKAFRALRAATQGAAVAQIALMAAGGPVGLASLAAGVLAAGAAYAYLDKKLAEVDSSAQDAATSLSAAVPGAAPATGGGGRTVEESDRTKKMQDQTRAAAETNKQLRQQIENTRTLRALDNSLLDIDQDRATAIRDYFNIAQTANAKIADLEAQIAAEQAKGRDTNNDLIRLYRERIVLAQQDAAEQVRARQEAEKRLETEKMIAHAKTTLAGLNQFAIQMNDEIALNNDRIALLKVYGSELDKVSSKLQVQQQAMLKMHELVAAGGQMTFKPNAQGKDPAQIASDIITLNSAITSGLNQYSVQLTKIAEQEAAGALSFQDAEAQRLAALFKFYQEYGFLIDETKQDEANALLLQMQNESSAYAKRLQMLKDYYDAKAKLEQSGVEGAKAALQQLADSTTPFQVAFDSVTSVFNNMNSALDTFVRTGKFKFKDFALSIIRDLIMIELRAKMVALFKAIGMSIFGLAEGGPATAGKPYIVGERGPELFVPKSSGTVIPNGQLVGGGGASSSASMGGPVTNNYITNNISAIDAKGVAQMFAENRKTLLGTVRYAQKELSYAGTPV